MGDEIVQNTHSCLSSIDLELEVVIRIVHLLVLPVEKVSDQVKNVVDFMTKIGIIRLCKIEKRLPQCTQLSFVVSYLLIRMIFLTILLYCKNIVTLRTSSAISRSS